MKKIGLFFELIMVLAVIIVGGAYVFGDGQSTLPDHQEIVTVVSEAQP